MPPTPPRGNKTAIFEECLMCIKHRKYRQKWPLGGASLGQGAGAQKTRTPAGNWFFSMFWLDFGARGRENIANSAVLFLVGAENTVNCNVLGAL